MTQFTRRIAGGLVAGLLLVSTACGVDSASSGSDGDAAGIGPGGKDGGGADVSVDGRSIEGLLRLVPADAADGMVLVSLYDVAAERADLDIEGEPGQQEYEMDRLVALTDPVGRLGAATPRLFGAARLPHGFDHLLFAPSELTAEIQVGEPPNAVTIGIGPDGGTVTDAALTFDGVTRREVAGTEIVSWLDDGEVDLTQTMPIGNLAGQAGRLAFPDDGVLVHTTNDADLERALAAIDGTSPSFTAHDDLVAIASVLDEEEAHAALLSGTPVQAVPGVGASKGDHVVEPTGALDPYSAIGIGPTFIDGRTGIVIVLTHASAEAAEANAKNLEQAIAERAEDTGSGRRPHPLGDPDIEARDGVLVARFTTEVPSAWIDLFVQRDDLIAFD